MRGLAVLVMIQCHAFNSFVRLDLRDGGPYNLSQFVGGMAAPLFLFMAGMTLGFLMDGLERREAQRRRRWLTALRRAGYVLGIAFLFRFTNWVASLPHADFQELTKVDILNCMGLGMAAISVAAVFEARGRALFAMAAGLAIAAAAPVATNLHWGATPALIQEYLVPGAGRGRFPFFPTAAYLGFGLAAGTIVKRAAAERVERLMQWAMLLGFGLVFGGQYFANMGYTFYSKSDFWRDSPMLILMRVGITLLLLAGSFLWTEYCTGAGWSWMQSMGKNSLMVYWVHVMLVYGNLAKPLKRALTISQAGLATVLVTAMMVAMSALWQRWKARRAGKWRAATSVAGGSARAIKAV